MQVQAEDVTAGKVSLLKYLEEGLLEGLVVEADALDPASGAKVMPRRAV